MRLHVNESRVCSTTGVDWFTAGLSGAVACKRGMEHVCLALRL